MELWDLYDEQGNLLNKQHSRGVPLPSGTYHRVSEIWTLTYEGEILVTLRDMRKELFPGFWECTGGAILAGENAVQGALRELREETGIQITESELHALGTHRSPDTITTTYLIRKNIKLDKLVLQDGEVVEAKFVTYPELVKMFDDNLFPPTLKERFNLVQSTFESFL